jgi:hypothetical protein
MNADCRDTHYDDQSEKGQDFWNKFGRCLKALISTGAEAVVSIGGMAKWYVGFLVKLCVSFFIASALLLLFLVLPTWLWKPETVGQLISIWWVCVGVLAFVFMLFAAPLLVAARILFKVVPAAGDITFWLGQVLAAVWFWILMLAVYFYVVPVGTKAISILLTALTLGTFTASANFNAERVRRFLTGKVIVLFSISTLLFTFPQVIRGVAGVVARLGDLGTRAVDSVNDPKPKEFQSMEEARAFRFFSGGKPQLYYDGDLMGDFQLFDSMGRLAFRANSPFTGRDLKPVKSEKERQQVMTWYEQHFKKMAAEARGREFRQEREEGRRAQARQEDERMQREIRETNERKERAVEGARVAHEQPKTRTEAKFLQFQQEQNAQIAKGIVPPLSVTVNRIRDSWRLYLENTSETVTVNITRLRKSTSGVEETTPFQKSMCPGEREYMAYQADFRLGDVLDVFCKSFQEPYRMVVQQHVEGVRATESAPAN